MDSDTQSPKSWDQVTKYTVIHNPLNSGIGSLTRYKYTLKTEYLQSQSQVLRAKLSNIPQSGVASDIKKKPKLPCVDFIFDRGSPASRVEPTALSEVLVPSPRLSSRVQNLSEDLRPSYLSFLFRGYCHKLSTIFSDAFTDYPRGYKIKGHLQQSSFILRLREASVMTWRCFAVRIEGLGSLSNVRRRLRPQSYTC